MDPYRDAIESRAMRLCLAIANDDEYAFRFTLNECRCAGCATGVMGALACAVVELLEERGGDWKTEYVGEIAARLKVKR
ncbi:hypothetical protein [Mycobacterium interjectum]|uniref:hypothetical protein n=1 Tax=Mycobacterium interjectum TaxID=33895 RepID=UPI00083130A3|nr:hypothetical protein [Mycobacterium interjectum]